ncbi:hypothetical protein MMC13_006105 [Lambiella insularis]|nr:hypothetical protein [Lambiella insularis]
MEIDGWTWSQEHQDWYRMELYPNGGRGIVWSQAGDKPEFFEAFPPGTPQLVRPAEAEEASDRRRPEREDNRWREGQSYNISNSGTQSDNLLEAFGALTTSGSGSSAFEPRGYTTNNAGSEASTVKNVHDASYWLTEIFRTSTGKSTCTHRRSGRSIWWMTSNNHGNYLWKNVRLLTGSTSRAQWQQLLFQRMQKSLWDSFSTGRVILTESLQKNMGIFGLPPTFFHPVTRRLKNIGDPYLGQWYQRKRPLKKLAANNLDERPYILLISVPNDDSGSNAKVAWTDQIYDFDFSQSPRCPPSSPELA